MSWLNKLMNGIQVCVAMVLPFLWFLSIGDVLLASPYDMPMIVNIVIIIGGPFFLWEVIESLFKKLKAVK